MKTIRMIETGLAAIIVLLATMPLAQARSGWRHRKLVSQQGNQIFIDYRVKKRGSNSSYKPAFSHMADPAYVNVKGPGLNENSRVRIVLNSYHHRGTPVGKASAPVTYVLDLKLSRSKQLGLHFSGKIDGAYVNRLRQKLGNGKDNPLLTGTSGYAGNRVIKQDIAVVIDGTWQRDPINRTNNFNFELGL